MASLIRWLSGGYKKEMDEVEFLTHIRDIIVRLAANINETNPEIH